MAGLLNQPGAQNPALPNEQQPPQPAPQQPAQQPAQEQPGQEQEADENNPAFQSAMKFARQSLYESGASDDIHKQLKMAKDKVETVANIAYEITSIVDERTEGAVPDELLILLASNMLAEVSDIAEASGIALKSSDVAQALKIMILRFVGEQGHDTQALKAAMDQVTPEQMDSMVEQYEPDGAMPEEPQQDAQGVI